MSVAARVGVLVLAAAVVLVDGAAPAAAYPVLEPQDAEELAAELADATETQGICYGWRVTVDDRDDVLDGVDVGSSRGAGTPAQTSDCPRWMVFEADLVYTESNSESEDSASFRVSSNVSGAPQEPDLRRVGVTGASLLGNSDDLAVINAALALPALAAELRLAPPIPIEPNNEAIPAHDGPTNRPGSDWTRAFGHFIVLSVVLMVGGLGWAGWAWAADRYGWGDHGDEATDAAAATDEGADDKGPDYDKGSDDE